MPNAPRDARLEQNPDADGALEIEIHLAGQLLVGPHQLVAAGYERHLATCAPEAALEHHVESMRRSKRFGLSEARHDSKLRDPNTERLRCGRKKRLVGAGAIVGWIAQRL